MKGAHGVGWWALSDGRNKMKSGLQDKGRKNKMEMKRACEWTNGGDEVLIVRCMSRDGKTSRKRLVNGCVVESEPFQNPIIIGEIVTAPDWSNKAECGGGIHGWPWALSLGEGKDCDWSGLWQVYGVKPKDIIDLDGKCKFRTGILRFSGDWQSATNFVLSGQIAFIHKSASGASSATGYRGASSATGARGASSATGYRGASSATGSMGASSATGDSGASSATGDSGASSATGASGASSATGKCSAAVATGVDSKAMGGEFGCIALTWWNEKESRLEMKCATTGNREGDLNPGVWYSLDAKGEFQAVI